MKFPCEVLKLDAVTALIAREAANRSSIAQPHTYRLVAGFDLRRWPTHSFLDLVESHLFAHGWKVRAHCFAASKSHMTFSAAALFEEEALTRGPVPWRTRLGRRSAQRPDEHGH